MAVSAKVIMDAPLGRVWQVITDIDNCQDRISGILSAEVLERPEQGLIGLKWTETRIMFGKEASETMWISAAEEPNWYETTAKSHGAVYTSRLELSETADGTELVMSFQSKAESLGAKIMSLFSFMFNGAMRKLLQQDLDDIKKFTEAG